MFFMNENSPDDSTKSAVAPDNQEIPEHCLSGNQDYIATAVQEKNVKRSAILLTTLFVIGRLCILFMIKKSTPQTAEASPAQEQEIEVAIAELTGIRTEFFTQMDEMVRKFNEFSDFEQVKLDQLQRDPFELSAIINPMSSSLDDDILNMANQRSTKNISDIELVGIMRYEEGYRCMIDDKLLYEGDSVGGFKVLRIGANFVELKAGNLTTILKLNTE